MADCGAFFSKTSNNIRLLEDGKKLAASCRTSGGQYLDSTFDLNFYLVNAEATIRFAAPSERPGNFTDSSSAIKLNGSLLGGNAAQSAGLTREFSLDLDKNLANVEGRLLWLVDPCQPFDHPNNDEGGFGTYDVSDDPNFQSHHSNRPKREANITPPSKQDEKDIQNLVRLWDLDMMDANLGQTTMVTFPRRPPPGGYTPYRQAWRIDNQENGAFLVEGSNLRYYSLAVQIGSAVYASVLVPVGYNVGRTRIRNAFLTSMQEGRTVTISQPVQGPAPPEQYLEDGRMNPRIRDVFVRGLLWTGMVVGSLLLL